MGSMSTPVEPHVDDRLERRREELLRVVYGTPDGATGDAAAELAAVEAELAERLGPADGGHVASGPADGGAVDGGHADIWQADDSDVPTDSGRADGLELDADSSLGLPRGGSGPVTAGEASGRHRPSRGRAIAAALGILAVVALAFAVLEPAREALSPPRGLAVFERAQTAEERGRTDEIATAAELQPSEAASLRTLGRAFGHDFWAFRDDDRVCLLVRRQFFFSWLTSCTSVDGFAEHGLSRRIVADDIRDGARPRRIGPGDVVVMTWGPESIDLEWTVER